MRRQTRPTGGSRTVQRGRRRGPIQAVLRPRLRPSGGVLRSSRCASLPSDPSHNPQGSPAQLSAAITTPSLGPTSPLRGRPPLESPQGSLLCDLSRQHPGVPARSGGLFAVTPLRRRSGLSSVSQGAPSAPGAAGVPAQRPGPYTSGASHSSPRGRLRSRLRQRSELALAPFRAFPLRRFRGPCSATWLTAAGRLRHVPVRLPSQPRPGGAPAPPSPLRGYPALESPQGFLLSDLQLTVGGPRTVQQSRLCDPVLAGLRPAFALQGASSSRAAAGTPAQRPGSSPSWHFRATERGRRREPARAALLPYLGP